MVHLLRPWSQSSRSVRLGTRIPVKRTYGHHGRLLVRPPTQVSGDPSSGRHPMSSSPPYWKTEGSSGVTTTVSNTMRPTWSWVRISNTYVHQHHRLSHSGRSPGTLLTYPRLPPTVLNHQEFGSLWYESVTPPDVSVRPTGTGIRGIIADTCNRDHRSPTH